MSFLVYICPAMKSIDIEKSIVVASTDLFLEYGFKTVTMDDIALNMKISKKTIYNFFSNKEALDKDVYFFLCTTSVMPHPLLILWIMNILPDFLLALSCAIALARFISGNDTKSGQIPKYATRLSNAFAFKSVPSSFKRVKPSLAMSSLMS